MYDFNTSNSQIANASNSWWSSSFVSGSDNHEYLIVSHLLATPTFSVYRGSIYDITEPEFYQFTETSVNTSLLDNNQGGAFNVSTADYYFGSTCPGNATKQLRTASTRSDVQYDITFDLSAPVIFNLGIGGYFQFGQDQTAEWSMPAGRTSGTLVRNGTTITIDPEQSLTWYDRQWNFGAATSFNWTWFELHLNDSSHKQPKKMSVWAYDDKVVGHRQWATIQPEAGINTVLPIVTFQPFGNPWTSPHTNNTYYQNWNVVLQDGTNLTIHSASNDQELYSSSFASYEGFITVSGTGPSGDMITGYGLVEIEDSF